MKLTRKEWIKITLLSIFMTLLVVLPIGFLIRASMLKLIKPDEVWFWGFICWGWGMMVIWGYRIISSLKMMWRD